VFNRKAKRNIKDRSTGLQIPFLGLLQGELTVGSLLKALTVPARPVGHGIGHPRKALNSL
jgi:hypothetical protein